ncbi:MAG: FapA family protein [Planctomycetota bacterium]|jgi:uncharacterized protein (DUF342 family)|nr:FapA family protein [Planctomycetota bacterium]
MTARHAQPQVSEATLAGRGGEPFPVVVAHSSANNEMSVRIVVEPTRMAAFIRLAPGPSFSGLSQDRLRDVLIDAGIVHGVDAIGLATYVLMQNSATPFDGYFQIAQGDPMRRGEDGSIEFHVLPTAAAPRYDQTDEGSIDFRQLNLIENCFAGQRVATIIPPGAGRAGKDVFGGVVPASPGAPAQVAAGPGVILNPNGKDFSSEIEGRLVHENHVLSVSPTLEIAHDIDYSVGNIDFVGKVVVNGSLLDGFSIKGKRGVEIRGEMGSATVESEGEVTIVGGVKGRGNAVIKCGSLKVRYIDDSTVEATGDVVSEKEILHSVVRSLGKVSIPRGTILGGEVWGFQGVEAETIGSEVGVNTRIMAGLNWTDENKLAEVRAKIAELSDRVRSAKQILEPLLNLPDASAQFDLEQKSMIADLISELRNLRDALAFLVEERESIVSRRQAGRVPQINVLRELNMGVVVRFSQISHEIKDAVKGPVSVVHDELRETQCIRSLFNLAPVRDPEPRPEAPEN